MTFKKIMGKQLETQDKVKSVDEWLLDLQWRRVQLLHKYNIPTDFDQKVVLFKAKEPYEPYAIDSHSSNYNHWERFCKNLTVETVNGNHETMFNKENAKILAKQLTQVLRHLEEKGLTPPAQLSKPGLFTDPPTSTEPATSPTTPPQQSPLSPPSSGGSPTKNF